uniref:Uncharacterized protein n=1 Tax=Arundo donax TaxID=35708 RepID=A0A0A9A4C7_ARUDO
MLRTIGSTRIFVLIFALILAYSADLLMSLH